MATVPWQDLSLSDRENPAGLHVRKRLKDQGRRILYHVAGLPIAVRALVDPHGARPEAIIRRAYARHFWRPKRASDAAALLLALLLWPAALIGLGALFTRKNGAAVVREARRSVPQQLSDQLRLYFAAGVLQPWYYIFELYRRPLNTHARQFIYRWESKGGVLGLLNERDGPPSPILRDKAAFADHCLKHQIATVPLLALVHHGIIEERVHPAEMDTDLFVKPVFGRGGKGAERWDHRGPGRYRSPQGQELDREQLFGRLAARSAAAPLMVQPRIANHPALDALNNGALSTVRILTCLDERGEPELVGPRCGWQSEATMSSTISMPAGSRQRSI
jgi:hypothetical protein